MTIARHASIERAFHFGVMSQLLILVLYYNFFLELTSIIIILLDPLTQIKDLPVQNVSLQQRLDIEVVRANLHFLLQEELVEEAQDTIDQHF